jgi:hypothetical protein
MAAAAGLALTSLTLPTTADANDHPRVKAGNCRALAASMGASRVWFAKFYGQRNGFWDEREEFSATACFRAESDCKNWLYWAYTDWPYMNNSQRCRRGLG